MATIRNLIKLLLVEHDHEQVVRFLDLLKEAGGSEFVVDTAGDLEEASVALLTGNYDLVLAELGLPEAQPLEAVEVLLAAARETPVVVLGGDTDQATALEAVRQGAEDYLIKRKIHPDDLARVIRYAIEKSRAAAALSRSESSFRVLFESNPLPMWVYDHETLAFLEVNEAMVYHFGYSRDELLRMDLTDIWPAEEMSTYLANIRKPRVGIYRTGSARFRLRNGKIIDAELMSHTIIFAGRTGSLVVANDVTARREAERALQRSEAEYRTMINELQEGLLVTDRQGNIISYNPSALTILGLTRDQVGLGTIFDPTWHVTREDGSPLPDDEWPATVALRTGEPLKNVVLCIYRPDGSNFWLLLNSHTLTYPGEEQPSLVFTSFFDITERKQQEADRLAKEAAEEANRAKSHFISRMSHELRTPLNAILGFAQLMEMEPRPPDDMDNVEQIIHGGRHLLNLINDVLDIARVEQGRLTLSLEAINAGEVIRESVDLIAGAAAERHITVRVDAKGLDEAPVMADRQRLKQVLLNYLSNAVKYNNEGGLIIVSYAVQPDGQVRLMVTDSGIGIASTMLHRLFSPFERLNADRTLVEGTGLGLAIAKQLTQAMGGTVGVNSDLGRGSTFWMQIPGAGQAVSDHPPDQTTTGEDQAQYTVMYIEDNPVSLRLVERILRQRPKVRLLSAHSGLGYELASQHHVDLILLDLHLPDMPGEVVLSKLRENPATAEIPVVIVSADTTPHLMAQLRAAGANDYLTKPIDVNQFLMVLDRMLKRS